jgi:hypothetical protein
MLSRPPIEGERDLSELRTSVGQLKDHGRCGAWKEPPSDQVGLLQLAQPGGQDIRRDSGEAAVKIGESQWPSSRLPHHVERPPPVDEIANGRDFRLACGDDRSFHRLVLS